MNDARTASVTNVTFFLANKYGTALRVQGSHDHDSSAIKTFSPVLRLLTWGLGCVSTVCCCYLCVGDSQAICSRSVSFLQHWVNLLPKRNRLLVDYTCIAHEMDQGH